MSFQVVPSTVPETAADWLRAKNLPVSELPELNEEQRAIAASFRVREEDYRRFQVYLRELTLARQRQQGEAFGRFVEQVLEPVKDRFGLQEVTRRETPEGWRIVVQDRLGGVVQLASSVDVVASIAEGKATPAQLDEFRQGLLDELGIVFRTAKQG